MKRHTLAAVAAAGLLAPLMPLGMASAADDPAATRKDSGTFTPATATAVSPTKTGPVIELGKGTQTYIIQLKQPAVPSRASATNAKGQTLAKAPGASSYRSSILADQKALKASIASTLGSKPAIKASWTEALNGFAIELSRAEAEKVSRLKGIGAIQVEGTYELTTDVGPEWIGAPDIWSGTGVPNGTGTKGEGVVVGIIDSGINAANPSFAASVPVADGGDGYVVTNPRPKYYGMCDPDHAQYTANWGCNDKLIGAYNFTGDGSKYDIGGHGTHTASTTAGNQVEVTTYAARGTEHEFSTTETIKGVAPHANIIAYDVCVDGCPGAAIVSAIEQAIADDVDAINYSIGSTSASSPWVQADTIGFLNARAAGISVATSAGNAGPGAATLGSPGDSPWMTTVGATQHNRQWQAHVTDITADGGATLPQIDGVSFSKSTGQAYPLVDATDLGSKLCIASELAGQDLTGKIVICERGTTGRVEKSEVVAALGAEGMILGNDAASGDSLNADAHALPSVHITHAALTELRTWLTGKTGAKAELSGGQRHTGDDVADIMASFSSRGPNRAVSILSPSVSAPGVDILAADGSDNEVNWGFMSGTSMASPHTAGALALLKGAQPNWTPAEAQSALMTTAKTAIKDNDGTDADWHDMGSGRIDLTKAAKAGVVFDVTEAEYLAADPADGGDVRTLNLASLADNDCLGSCSWTRTGTVSDNAAGTWTASVSSSSPDLELTLAQTSFDVAAGGTIELDVTADVATIEDTWLYGTVVLTPPAGSSAPAAHLPVAVLPSAGVLPSSVDITTRRDAGSQLSGDLRIAADSAEATFEASGLVPAEESDVSLPLDSTNSDPFDDLSQVHVEKVQVPAGATALTFTIADSTSPDMDLYVGTGEISDANVACFSATGGSDESCTVASPEAGEWWAVVQNWDDSTPGATDTATLQSVVVAGNSAGFSVEGPSPDVASGEPFSVRAFWDDESIKAGDVLYGAIDVVVGGESAGLIPVTFNRVADDVTKTADKSEAVPGDTVTYTVDVQPNVTPTDLEYTITDTIPDGMTYVDGSATGGATYADGKVTWTDTLVSPDNAKGSYEWSTSQADPTCVNPLTGEAEYVDLLTASGGAIKAQAGVAGDTDAWSAFSALTFGHYGAQQSGLTISDDGFVVRSTAGYGGKPWETQTVPNEALPNDLNAILWQDMEIVYDEATNKGLSLAQFGEQGATPDFAILEYDDVHAYGQAAQTYDAQIIVPVGGNDVYYAYDNLNGPLDAVTIGGENADGTTGHALVNNGDASEVIANGTVVCGTYTPGASGAGQFSYQVTVDADAASGVVTNSAKHTVDNPGAKPAVATADVKVTGSSTPGQVDSATTLTLNPTSVAAGGTTTAKATVTGAGGTPTGKVDFLVNGTVAGSGTLAADGTASATLTASATAGTYSVVAKYAGDSAFKASESAAATLTVTSTAPPTKAEPTIKIKTPKKVKVKAKGAKVKVAVKASGVKPTGKVKIVIKGAGKKITRTVTLKNGKATIKLPKFKKVGKVKVKVTYSGDEAVLSGKAKATFKVVRR